MANSSSSWRSSAYSVTNRFSRRLSSSSVFSRRASLILKGSVQIMPLLAQQAALDLGPSKAICRVSLLERYSLTLDASTNEHALARRSIICTCVHYCCQFW